MAHTDTEAITAAIEFMDGSESAMDLNETQRRAYLKRKLQQSVDFVWRMRDWTQTFAETAVTILAGQQSVAVPATFQKFGRAGSLWDTAQGRQMQDVGMLNLQRLRRKLGPNNGNLTLAFALFDSKIQIPYVTSSSRPIVAFHKTKPPTFTDSPSVSFPDWLDQYYDTVIFPGLVVQAEISLEDQRSTWAEQWNAGISQMISDEQEMQTSQRQLPRAVLGRVW